MSLPGASTVPAAGLYENLPASGAPSKEAVASSWAVLSRVPARIGAGSAHVRVGIAWLTVNGNEVLLGWSSVLPLYAIVNVCVPAAVGMPVRLATPSPRLTVSRIVEPSSRLTVPTGVPVPGLTKLTVASTANDWPNVAVGGGSVTTTLVAFGATVTVMGPVVCDDRRACDGHGQRVAGAPLIEGQVGERRNAVDDRLLDATAQDRAAGVIVEGDRHGAAVDRVACRIVDRGGQLEALAGDDV